MFSNPPPTVPIAPNGNYKQRVEMRVKSQEAMVKTFAWDCCANCERWDKKTDQCGLFEMRPPVIVIATGCVEYEAEIPF